MNETPIRAADFTQQQQKVTLLLATGETRAGIASRLRISPGTVARHIEKARLHARARTVSALVCTAYAVLLLEQPQPTGRGEQLPEELLLVIKLLAAGYRSNEIAGRVGCDVRTVRRRRAELRERLGAQTDAHLMTKALAAGLL
ncbi:LuxR C-terminal-related transcriptional regulator [Streptomyces sp. NPDC058734]|uniref:LuxR C-terminal-related transcriptional regulator n=1 Tax=Streptomyces sp. NPDC058734 TaxID=3346615 RepID=UPI0036AE0E8D